MKKIIPVVVCLLVAASAFPQRGPGGAPPPPPPGGPNAAHALADYLGLTESQQVAAEAIDADFRASAEPIHAQIRALHEQIKAAHEAADAKFLALLTAEQRAKFEAFRAAAEFLRRGGPGGGARP